MNDEKLKSFLLQAFEDANALKFHDSALKKDFIGGKSDILFDEMEMDSLAVMEICIAIELEFGISIVPEHFVMYGSINKVIEHLRSMTK